MTNSFWRFVAKCVAPHLARTPVIFGDPEKVVIAKTARVVNALINVQSGNVRINDYVFFGHNVCLLTGSHEINVDGKLRATSIVRCGRDISIDESAWLTSNVTVIGPSRIGKNAVILPGSEVTCDVPDNCIYGGIPARLIREM